jgi:hypothetical protein
MDLSHLEEYHKLCPKTTFLFIDCKKNPENVKFISKFEQLTSIKFKSDLPFEFCFLFLKSLKDDNKVESIFFPSDNPTNEKVVEFHKILFSKVKLTSFENRFQHFFSNYSELNTIGSWIEKNSIVKKIDLNCKKSFF